MAIERRNSEFKIGDKVRTPISGNNTVEVVEVFYIGLRRFQPLPGFSGGEYEMWGYRVREIAPGRTAYEYDTEIAYRA